MIRRLIADREVAAIGLGCMGMSWAYGADERDDDSAVAVIHEALDRGVQHLDTAVSYGSGANESLVGRALADRLDEVLVATKTGLFVEDAASYTLYRDGRPEAIRASLDASLARLRRDRIDLLYLHRVDPAVPLAETWGAMADAVDTGRVRWLGLSEVTLAQLAQAHAIHPVTAVQSELSLWSRDALGVALPTQPVDTGRPAYNAGGAAPEDVVGWCRDHGTAFVAFSPLGRGYLTGAVDGVRSDDFRALNPRFQPAALAANRVLVERVREVADRHGATPAQVALAWVLAQGPHVHAIPGTKKVAYLRQNVAAADLVLGAEDLSDLDDLPTVHGSRY
jgi:aryl-alcohol dehydrogenase-like predicted oxidoreductase